MSPKVATSPLVALALIAAFHAPTMAAAQGLSPAPMRSPAGTVLVYRTARGDIVEDSIAETGSDRVLLVRRTATDGATSVVQREVRRTAAGYRQIDAGGEQLLTPLPWPPAGDWEASYRDLRLRYTRLGTEVITVPHGTFTTTRLQLAIVGRSTTMVDLWIDPALGIVRRTTRGGGLASDYELVALRPPQGRLFADGAQRTAQPTVTPQSAPPSPVPAARSASSASRVYLGGGGWWFDRDISRRADEYDDTSLGLLGWHVEAGIAGPIGVRMRYGQAREQLADGYQGRGARPTDIHLLTAELLVALVSTRVGRLYVGAGGQWTADRELESPEWRDALIGTVGLDTGVRPGWAVYGEFQWATGGVPYHVALDREVQRGGGIMLLGVRVH